MNDATRIPDCVGELPGRPFALPYNATMKVVIVIAFVLILASLGSALVFLVRDRGRTRNVVRALSLRVGFSIALFLLILLAHYLGWIESTGLRVGP